MAGFDAEFLFRPEDEVLVRSLFAAGRRRARLLEVKWRSLIRPPGYAYVSLNGNTFRLDMLLERIRRDLPTVAEGIDTSPRTPEQRRRLANGVVDVLGRFRVSFYDRYPEGHIPALRAVRQPVTLAMYDLFPRRHEDLWPRLEVTLDVLASWALNEIAPEVALEELHSAFELLLTRAAGKTRAPAFADLVAVAAAKGWLGDTFTEPAIARILWDEPAKGLSERDLLLSMKDERKSSKHRGGSGAGVWLETYFWPATTVLEQVSSRMP